MKTLALAFLALFFRTKINVEIEKRKTRKRGIDILHEQTMKNAQEINKLKT